MLKEISKDAIKITDLATTKAIEVAETVEVSSANISIELEKIARDKLKQERFEIIKKIDDPTSGYCGTCRRNMDMLAVYKVKIVNARILLIGYCIECETLIYKKEGGIG